MTALRENLDNKILVSCKIRLLENLEETINFVNAIQNTGINFFTVHFRTRHQSAKDKANWSMIKDIRKIAKIPFFANGDIFSPSDIKVIMKCKD